MKSGTIPPLAGIPPFPTTRVICRKGRCEPFSDRQASSPKISWPSNSGRRLSEEGDRVKPLSPFSSSPHRITAPMSNTVATLSPSRSLCLPCLSTYGRVDGLQTLLPKERRDGVIELRVAPGPQPALPIEGGEGAFHDDRISCLSTPSGHKPTQGQRHRQIHEPVYTAVKQTTLTSCTSASVSTREQVNRLSSRWAETLVCDPQGVVLRKDEHD